MRGRRSEGRGQEKTEVGGRRTEIRGRLATDTHGLTQTFVRQASPAKKSHRFAKDILSCNSNSALIFCTLPEWHERKGVKKG